MTIKILNKKWHPQQFIAFFIFVKKLQKNLARLNLFDV